MTFIESVKTCLRKYVNFKGRATRSEYWWFQLFTLGVFVFTLIVDYTIGLDPLETDTFLTTTGSLLVAVPLLAVTARRLHDMGITGWIQFPVVFLYIHYLDLLFPGLGENSVVSYLENGAGVLWVVILILCIKNGNPRTNKYGPDPKSDGVSEVFS